MSLTFGQKLAQRRQWMGWSMAQAAHQLDVQVDTYRSWENERHTPHRMVQVGCLSLLDDAAKNHALEILDALQERTAQ
jgi:DNA-binding transcriptional regulator YiaG